MPWCETSIRSMEMNLKRPWVFSVVNAATTSKTLMQRLSLKFCTAPLLSPNFQLLRLRKARSLQRGSSFDALAAIGKVLGLAAKDLLIVDP